MSLALFLCLLKNFFKISPTKPLHNGIYNERSCFHMQRRKEIKGIMKLAEEYNMQNNSLFLSTLERYEFQLNILDSLQESINQEGTTITKEYVKSRENLYIHPAIKEYNKTADSANKTLSLIMKILKEFGEAEVKEESEIMKFIKSGYS